MPLTNREITKNFGSEIYYLNTEGYSLGSDLMKLYILRCELKIHY